MDNKREKSPDKKKKGTAAGQNTKPKKEGAAKKVKASAANEDSAEK